MANFVPSELTISYDQTVTANIGDDILDYIDPRNFRFEITGNGEKVFDVNKIRITDPEFKGEEILTDKFESFGSYQQIMYVFIKDIKNLLPNRVTINNRVALPEEVIMMGEDIIVLRRDVNILKEEVPEMNEQENNFDVSSEELSEKTNSIWKNEAIEPTVLYTKMDSPAHIYDAFGAENEENDFELGVEFDARIKRINTLEKQEYYKVADNVYILTSDAIDKDMYESQLEAIKVAQEADETPLEIEEVEEETKAREFNPDEDLIEEEVTPFKIIVNPDVVPMFFDREGISNSNKKPDPASIWTVTAILKNDFVGAEYYKVSENDYILKADTIEYSEDNLAKAQEAAENNDFNYSGAVVLTPDQIAKIDAQTPVEEEIKETAKVDAHAARKEFDKIPDPKEVNGIVQIHGDKGDTFNLYDSYRDDRNKLDATVMGETFWYTTTLGKDSQGNEFYEIAVNEWVAAEDVNYFENN